MGEGGKGADGSCTDDSLLQVYSVVDEADVGGWVAGEGALLG